MVVVLDSALRHVVICVGEKCVCVIARRRQTRRRGMQIHNWPVNVVFVFFFFEVEVCRCRCRDINHPNCLSEERVEHCVLCLSVPDGSVGAGGGGGGGE